MQGLVSVAQFADFDADGKQDLALAGEFMPVVILKNAQLK